MGQNRYIKSFGGEHEGKRSFGRPGGRWEDNNKTNIQKVGWEGTDWNDMPQDRNRWLALTNAVINLLITYTAAGNLLTS